MRRLHIAVACFLGGISGAFVALEITDLFVPISLAIGMIVGAGIGYLAYEWQKVPVALRQAWRDVVKWEPEWKRFGCLMATWLLVSVSVVPLIAGVIAGVTFFAEWTLGESEALKHGFEVGTIFQGLLSSLALLMIATDLYEAGSDTDYVYKKVWNVAKRANVIVAPVWACYGLTVALWWLAFAAIPGLFGQALSLFGQALTLLGKVVKRTFVYIHSEYRVLCALDSALGTIVGFFLGSALLGGLAGLAIGILSYELVSVRILGLNGAPARSN